MAFDAASPFAGFACGLGFVTLRAEHLEVLVVVVVGAALVVDVVDLQVLGTTALNALIPIAFEDSFTCGGGDVGFGVCPGHRSPFFVPCSGHEPVACISGG